MIAELAESCRCGRTCPPGRRTCDECVARNLNRRAMYVAAGRCRCGRPRTTKHRQCAGCRERDAIRKGLAA